ncbi:hypothetical protein SAMN02910262_00014 [[Clostridium] aminophilum]|uniref:Uncharacterized protein n=1 Tax=[Clostridium] aminophilum TaxID=1526 RepID=A0A1I6I967_9FIRM|nr:hypothetical protein SAMN02910262_00014 [[Clostridium] aminophilum]
MITLLWESLNRMEAGRDPVVGAVCGKGMDAGGNLWSVLSWEKGWKTQRRCRRIVHAEPDSGAIRNRKEIGKDERTL